LDVKPEEAIDTEESDASGSISLTPAPPEKPAGPSGFKARQPKKDFRSKPTSGNTEKQPGPQVGDQVFQDSLQMVQMGLKEMKEDYQYVSQSVSQLCSTLGCKQEELVEKMSEAMESKKLKSELDSLRVEKRAWIQEKQRMNKKYRQLAQDAAVGKEKLRSRYQTEQEVANLLREMEHFLFVEPASATEGYLVEKMVKANNPEADAIKIMGLLQFYKDKNLKAYQDSKKVKEELSVLKQYMAYERRLRERLATGPTQDFKLMLPDLPPLTPKARERVEWYIASTASTIPPFTDFSSYCHFLKARLFALYDLPHSLEPMEVEYLREIFSSMQENVVHRSTFVFLVCTGEIQCLVPETLFCQLSNIAAYMLQLVYHFLEQAPDIAPTVNRKVDAFDFCKQPCIFGIGRCKEVVGRMWDRP
jgi:hypothetical protein